MVHQHRSNAFLLAANLLLLPMLFAAAAAIPDPPIIESQARVKQHRAGARGDLVAGEEELRKIIVYWPATPGAVGYEICQNCWVDDATGIRSGEQGTVRDVGTRDTCGGDHRMCAVYPGAPLGKNRFNVRVQTAGGDWSVWSPHANFFVDEPGFADHQHDEL